MDIKTTVLNSNLEEKIYIDQCIGFVLKVQRIESVVLKDPFMVLSSLSDRGISNSMKLLFLLA